MKVALLCSGLGNILRGHEVFARDLFDLLQHDLNISLFKGGGPASERELVLNHIPRDAACLGQIHALASPKWRIAECEQERLRVEGETFAYASLQPLLEGDFDIIHCLEREVCTVLYAQRHLFRRTPRILWSNGGAIPAADQPPCDSVQEHSQYNLARSQRRKAFMIPHGVDSSRFNPDIPTDFRDRHGIPADAFVVISVGSICFWHKRMDYIIREVAAVSGAWLVIVGQPTADTPAIRQLGEALMGDRIVFDTLPHDELPQAYAAADVFALGSLSETFGIVYIEAMAMGLPVVCTNHPNQRGIVQDGFFVDMARTGAVTELLNSTPRQAFAEMGARGRAVALRDYELSCLRSDYLKKYNEIAATPVNLPRISSTKRLISQAKSAGRTVRNLFDSI